MVASAPNNKKENYTSSRVLMVDSITTHPCHMISFQAPDQPQAQKASCVRVCEREPALVGTPLGLFGGLRRHAVWPGLVKKKYAKALI